MKRKRFEFILQAQQPIAHHEGAIGNMSTLMRERVFQPGGTSELVPIVTGDTMRHGLREAAAYATLDAAGLLGERAFSQAALRLLFAGGQIAGSSGGSVQFDSYREMCDIFPPISILGGCAQNRSVPGRLSVDSARLVCEETRHLLPEWVTGWIAESRGDTDSDMALSSFRDHVEEETRVRMDPALDPMKRQLLSDGGADVEKQLDDGEKASAAKDAKGKDEAKSTMLPRSYEVVAAGSLFWWGCESWVISEVEEDTFDVMCAAFLSNARVGGKKGTGHGLVKPVAGFLVPVMTPMEGAEKIDKLGERVGSTFRRHVGDRAEELAEFLRTIKA